MRKLDLIGIEYGTDKSSMAHDYLRYYDMFFASMREMPIKLLEIGVWEGASLNMWAEYFEKGYIVGMDIDEKESLRTNRIHTFKGNQGSMRDLYEVSTLADFDIIIEDGSHTSGHQIFSFEILFKLLKPGGLYCIEDVLCAYDGRWCRVGEKSVIDRIKEMVGEVQMNGKIPGSALCANKTEAVKMYDGTYFEKNIEWVFTSCGLAIIKKLG